MQYNFSSAAGSRLIAFRITVGLLAVLIFQTVILVAWNASPATHVAYTINLVTVWAFTTLFYLLCRPGRYSEPYPIYAIFFVIYYYFSTLYMMFRKDPLSNIIFSYSHVDVITPLLISALGFATFSIGYLVMRLSFGRRRFRKHEREAHEELRRNRMNLVAPIFVAWLLIYAAKSYLLKSGVIGSLAGFAEGQQSPLGSLSFLRPFFSFGPVFVAYFAIYHFRFRNGVWLLGLVLAAEVVYSVIAGDRRFILYLLLTVFAASRCFGFYLFKSRLNLILVFLLAVLLFYVGSAAQELLNNLAGTGNIDYYAVALHMISRADAFSSERLTAVLDNLFGVFNQLYLVDTAVRIHASSYEYAESPLNVYLANLLPFGQTLGVSSIGPYELQFPLFKESLYRAGDTPYLTLPQIAESYVAGGLIGLALYSFGYGALMCLIYQLAMTSSPALVWYIAFFPFLSLGFHMSLLSSFVFPVKALMMFVLLRFIFKVFPRRPRRREAVGAGDV